MFCVCSERSSVRVLSYVCGTYHLEPQYLKAAFVRDSVEAQYHSTLMFL